MVLAGESPSSSSASDVDNLNNHTLAPSDKGTMTQMGRAGTASPQKIPGVAAPTSHSIPPRLRTNLIRFLKDVCSLLFPFSSFFGVICRLF